MISLIRRNFFHPAKAASLCSMASVFALCFLVRDASATLSNTPNNWFTPNNTVNAVLHDGTTTYIGGAFTSIGINVGHGMPVSTVTGLPNTAFPIADGSIDVSTPDGNGGWYVGGNFSTIGGISQPHAAHILSDGSVDSGWRPDLDGGVYCLSLSGTTLYAGGSFSGSLAKIDHDGTAQTHWTPALNDQVNAVIATPQGIYIGGYFTTIGATPRLHAAEIAADGTPMSWNPAPDGAVLTFARSDFTIYMGGYFTHVGVNNIQYLAAVGTDGTVNTGFAPTPNDIVRTIAGTSSALYIGGDFTQVNSTPAAYITALDADGHVKSGWDNGADSSVFTILLSGTTVYVGGSFTTIQGESRGLLAALDTNGQVLSWNPMADNTVDSLSIQGSQIFVGGYLTQLQSQTRLHLAAFDNHGNLLDWNPDVNGTVQSMALSGSTIFVGGGFSTVGDLPHANIAAISTDGTVLDWHGSVSATVESLEATPSGVYAGGSFLLVGPNGSVPSTGLALFDGNGNAEDIPYATKNGSGIFSFARHNSTLYAGGVFTSIGKNSGDGAPVSATTAQTVSVYAKPNGSVFASVSDGSGGWYIGGDFSYVGGVARSHAAHILSGGTLDSSWDPSPSGDVYALAVKSGTVYIGGSFSQVHNKDGSTATRNNVAAFSGDGTLQTWNPDPNNSVRALAFSGTSIVIAGTFTTLQSGSISQNGAAIIRSNGTLQSNWRPLFKTGVCTSCASVYAVATSGSTVFAGGAFDSVNSTTKQQIASFTKTGALVTGWDAGLSSGHSVYSILQSGSTLYVGGSLTVNNHGTTQNYLVSLSATTGSPIAGWNPAPDSYVNVIAKTGSTLYVGGTFNNIGGASRLYVASLNADGTAASWNPRPDNIVYTLTTQGSSVYVGGSFTVINLQNRNYLAAFDTTSNNLLSWAPNADDWVYALASSGSTIYAGGRFTGINTVSPPYLSAIDTDGNVIAAGLPSPNGFVHAIDATKNGLYVGGAFTQLGSTTRNKAALLGAGAQILAWDPNISSDDASVYTISTIPGSDWTQDTVFVGGEFDNYNSANHYYKDLAVFNAPGDPDIFSTPSTSSSDTSSAPTGPVQSAGGSRGHGGTLRKEFLDSAGKKTTMQNGHPAASNTHAHEHISVTGADGKTHTFSDVWTDDWFGTYVQDVAEKQIFTGYKDNAGKPLGLYGPGDPITIGQLAKAADLLGNTKVTGTTTSDHWAVPYMEAAKAAKLSIFLSSLPATNQATRGQVIQTLLETLGIPLQSGTPNFSDVPASSPYAQAIFTAMQLGIVSGDTDATGRLVGTFRPDAAINRAEVAKMIILALKAVGK